MRLGPSDRAVTELFGKYQSRKPVTFRGVGGKAGSYVKHDVIVRFNLKIQRGWLLPLEVAYGVVKDGAFPGELILGNSADPTESPRTSHPGLAIFRGIEVPDFLNGLRNVKMNNELTCPTTEEIDAKLNKSLEAQHRRHIAKWNNRLPGVFDKKFRINADKAVVMHRIDTGNATRLRSAPGQYSPAQEAETRFFVQQRDGRLIPRSKSSWSSHELLMPKKNRGGILESKLERQNAAKRNCLEVLLRFSTRE